MGCEKGCCFCYNPKNEVARFKKSINQKLKLNKSLKPKKLTVGMEQQLQLEQAKQNIDDVIEGIKEDEERDYYSHKKTSEEPRGLIEGEESQGINLARKVIKKTKPITLSEIKDIIKRKEFNRFYRNLEVGEDYLN